MAHCCKSGTAAPGAYEPRGEFRAIGSLRVYESGHAILEHEQEILLLLPDGFGLALHNIILADRFAQEGWHVVVPDYFEGDALPIDILNGKIHLSFDDQPPQDCAAPERKEVNLPIWLRRHDHEHISSLLAGLTKALEDENPSASLFGVGYCFGGKHVLRLAQSSLKAAASFHPSMVVAEDLAGIPVPLYVGLAALDDMVPETLAQDLQSWRSTMMKPDTPFTLQMYSGMGHGFAARPNTQDEAIKRQYERAFADTVEFLARSKGWS